MRQLVRFGLLLGLLSWTSSIPALGQDEIQFFEAEAEAIAAAVDRVGDAVVQIEIVGVVEVAAGEIAVDAPTAGTIVDPSGYILASSLVTARPSASILVVLQDGTRLPAVVVAEDKGRELVLLKVQPAEPLPAIEIRPPGAVRVGQYAIAVGRVRNDGAPARSIGIISALGRLNGRALQTDARISPPFYGGPLINIGGEVLGIVVPAMPDEGGTGDKVGWYDAGIAFVTPFEQIAKRFERMKQGETILPGKLGIVAANSDSLADGTEIAAIRIGSPAAEVEMQAGDTIETINGIAVHRHGDIKMALGPLDSGDTVEIQVKRGEETLTMQPTLVGDIPPFTPQSLGLLVKESDGKVVVEGVFPNSPALVAGVLIGDVITSLDGKALSQLEQFRNRVMSMRPTREATLVVSRGDALETLTITPDSVAGKLQDELPALPGPSIEGEWSSSELTLPDVPNKAWMLAPAVKPEETPLGLLLVFAEPGTDDLSSKVEAHKKNAQQFHVIVAYLGSADPKRWSPEEAELGSRVIAMIRKRFVIQPHAIAVTGEGAGGTMALVAAMFDSGTFSGVAVSVDTKPPAIQLRENNPSAPLHVLLQGDKLPPWTEVLGKAGYALLTSPGDQLAWFHYVWTLART